MHDLSFRYPERDDEESAGLIIENLNCSVPAGRLVVFKHQSRGRSREGTTQGTKGTTTLLRLIAR
eukprot:gene9005-6321_t